MIVALTKDQRLFLALLASHHPPEWFGWKQAMPNGLLAPAHGHFSMWTHFGAMRSGAEPTETTVTKAELSEMTKAGLVLACRITDAGRRALETVPA